MAALPSQFYKDPSELVDAIRRNECDGCASELVVSFNYEKTRSCERGSKHSDNGGTRCNFYKKTEAKNGIK